MKTGREYVESLRTLKTKIYAFGEQVKEWVDDPLFRPHINAAALTVHCLGGKHAWSRFSPGPAGCDYASRQPGAQEKFG